MKSYVVLDSVISNSLRQRDLHNCHPAHSPAKLHFATMRGPSDPGVALS